MGREYRIYLDGKLDNICCSDYALMCNTTSLINQYGKDRVEIKECDDTLDEEKIEYLKKVVEGLH
ncbi:hypothetical protein [Clostridium thermobutyricum]|uniref:hypothetical protein n=1 Tax=Clostridium thermobutyricum TaxID=29372 RepID=UPI003F52845F